MRKLIGEEKKKEKRKRRRKEQLFLEMQSTKIVELEKMIKAVSFYSIFLLFS